MSRKLKDCIQVSVYEEVDGRTRTPLKKNRKCEESRGGEREEAPRYSAGREVWAAQRRCIRSGG